MEDIEERLNEIDAVVYSEVAEGEKLYGGKLEQFKQRLHITWEPDPIYFTKSKIIFCEINDYKRFKEVFRSSKDILKLEMPDHNLYLYIVDIVECEDINYVLGTLETDPVNIP